MHDNVKPDRNKLSIFFCVSTSMLYTIPFIHPKIICKESMNYLTFNINTIQIKSTLGLYIFTNQFFNHIIQLQFLIKTLNCIKVHETIYNI